jgi:hypothetical protein
MKTLCIPTLAWALAMAGCNSSQPASANDGGPPASDATLPEAGDAAGDAGDDSTAAQDAQDVGTSPCTDLEGGTLAPSTDCLLVGQCSLGCVHGTATAYACAPDDAGNATFPSTFVPPADPVHVIEYVPGGGPWDGGAYVSCAPLACVRWSLADHGPTGSAWALDPCSNPDAAGATQAWACPDYQGFQPAMAGCFNSGAGQQVGGAGTPLMTNVVWCCPGAFEEGGVEGGPANEAGTGDGASTEGGSDAGADATSE